MPSTCKVFNECPKVPCNYFKMCILGKALPLLKSQLFHGCGASLLALVTAKTRAEIAPQPWGSVEFCCFLIPHRTLLFHSICVYFIQTIYSY